MPASEARVAANRANALKSTGPKTAEGKGRSRGNALKHGLCAEVLKTPEEGGPDFGAASGSPRTIQEWAVEQATVTAGRLIRAARMEQGLRVRAIKRAILCWDDDRACEAAELGEKIGRSPQAVVERLKRTPQGCDWLMGRWALLAHAADTQGNWTPEQTRLAFDLLGTPAEARAIPPGTPVDPLGRPAGPAPALAVLARSRIEELRGRQAVAAQLDELDRSLAQADQLDDPSPEARQLRRYEADLHRRLKTFLALLETRPEPEPEPEAIPEPEPETQSAPEPARNEAKPEPARPVSPKPAPAPRSFPVAPAPRLAPPVPARDTETFELGLAIGRAPGSR